MAVRGALMNIRNTYMDMQQSALFALLPALEEFSQSSKLGGINLFEAAGMVHHEIRHSNFLGFILDPARDHGLEDDFLKRLMQVAAVNHSNSSPSPLRIMLSDYTDAIVRREWMNIDIVVISESNKTIFAIENKVGSKEGKHKISGKMQLHGYREKIDGCPEYQGWNKILAFLTLDGEEGSDDNWSRISYDEVVKCIEKTTATKHLKLSKEVEIILQHYVELVRRNILKNDEELIKECREIYSRHKTAIDLIMEHGIVSNFKDAAEQFFKDHSDLQKYLVNSNQAFFLPTKLMQAIPEIEGVKWWNQSRPFGIWFSFVGGNKLGIIVEIGPFGDKSQYDRELLVNRIFQGLNINRQRITNTYTRVHSRYIEVTEDVSTEEMLSKLNSLYQEIQLQLNKVIEIAAQFFHEKLPKSEEQSIGSELQQSK